MLYSVLSYNAELASRHKIWSTKSAKKRHLCASIPAHSLHILNFSKFLHFRKYFEEFISKILGIHFRKYFGEFISQNFGHTFSEIFWRIYLKTFEHTFSEIFWRIYQKTFGHTFSEIFWRIYQKTFGHTFSENLNFWGYIFGNILKNL